MKFTTKISKSKIIQEMTLKYQSFKFEVVLDRRENDAIASFDLPTTLLKENFRDIHTVTFKILGVSILC